MAHLEYFPPERIALMEEIYNHPDLMEKLGDLALNGVAADEFEMRLAAVAAHCGVAMDGDYLQSDLTKLCDILVDKLRKKRTIIFS